MADVPIYKPAVSIQAPGTPQARVEAIAPGSVPTIFESNAKMGEVVTNLGAQVTQHMVIQEKLAQQQDSYAKQEGYKAALQDTLADPEKGLLAKFKGVNSPEALAEFDKLRKGVPAQPGIPGTPSLRDQFLKDASPYERAQLAKSFDSIDSMYRGKIINHVLSQTEAASKAINEANIDSHMKDAALVTTTAVHDPDDENKLIPAITLAENKMRDTIKNDVYFKKQGHPPEVTNRIVQDHVNQLVKTAVEANVSKNWDDAQKILDASTASPDAKAAIQDKIINGARIEQYTETLGSAVLKNPELRTADSQIDEVKANAFIKSKLETEKAGAHPLPPGHIDAMVSRVQTQISIQNRAITQKQQLVMNKASNDIWAAQQKGVPPTEAYNQFVKNGQFDNAIERSKAEDVFKKVYERDATALDAVWSHMTEAQKNAISSIEGRKDFLDKFSTSEDKKIFIDSLKQRIIEGRVQSPDAINKLYMDQIKDAATGAPKFFWNWTGKKMQPQHEIDATLQANQPVVKAVGGLNAAAALAQSLGGPDKLAPDTNESKAILLLSKYGKPINADTISTVISKHPDLLK